MTTRIAATAIVSQNDDMMSCFITVLFRERVAGPDYHC